VTRFADLHIHTHYSDSTSSPEEVVEEAVKAGLSCIAITDHDTLDGIKPTQAAAQARGLEVIAGIELSSEIQGKDVHVLGYFVSENNTPLGAALEKMQKARVERIAKMIVKLKEFGIDNIELEEVTRLTRSAAVGRPHLAAVLLEKKWVSSLREAFDKYLAEGAAAYVEKYRQSPQEAIELIIASGGVAVLAHPMLTQIDELIPGLVNSGLKGLEVYYPNCSAEVTGYYEGLARKHGLIATGGSDAHGNMKKHTRVGKTKVPYAVVEALKELRHAVAQKGGHDT
jgi:hypothetical protein